MNLYIGCPIWSWKGWVGNFYPEGTKPAEFLHEYARRLTTVEGNTTFYAVPAQDAGRLGGGNALDLPLLPKGSESDQP